MKTEVGQMGIAISEASAEDAEALERLINSAYRGASALQGWSTEAELIDGTRTDAELIREIINDTSAVLLKAVSDSSIVGCVELRLEGDRLYLGMLTVRPDLQSQGIGKELLRVSEAEAKRWGCRTIFMTVLTVRKLLIDWYLRHGYRDTGERKPFAFTDPRYGKPRMPLEFAVLEKQLN
ncbi:MAG TPA: GNAT family N-acetyltransferase [Cyclobacteriaceae bacterium]